MGKFDRYDKFQEMQQQPASQVHPIWRGIGCVMLILIPILAYAAADTFFDNASNISVLGSTVFPRSGILYRVYFSFPLWENTLLRISPFHLVFMIVFSVLGYLVLSMVYAIVYRVTGPPKYGPTDSPPLRRPRKSRRR